MEETKKPHPHPHPDQKPGPTITNLFTLPAEWPSGSYAIRMPDGKEHGFTIGSPLPSGTVISATPPAPPPA